MKKLLLFAGLAAATLSFVGCNKQEADYAGNDGKFTIRFVTPETKTTNDGLSTKWAKGDNLTVFYAPAGTKDYSENIKFTFADEEAAANGVATAEVELGTGSYDWYAIYPYANKYSTPENTDCYATLGSSSSGSQTQDGLDKKSHLAGYNYPVVGKATSAASAAPTIKMKQLTTVIAVKVKNTTTAPIKVNTVNVTAPKDLVGGFFVNFASETPVIVPEDGYTGKTAKLAVTGDNTIAAGATGTFYLAVCPFSVSNADLTVKIIADEGSVEKTKKVTADFQAGHIKTVNVDFDNASGPAEIIEATVKEFLAASVSEDQWYQLTGIVSNITSTTYGNFDLTDETGTVYIYGLTKTKVAKNDKSFADLDVQDGDKVTIISLRSEYNGIAQGGGNTPAYFVSKEDGTVPIGTVNISPSSALNGGMTGTAGEQHCTVEGISIDLSNGLANSDQIRIYKNATITIQAPSGKKLKKVVFNCTAKDTAQYGPGNFADYSGYSFSGTVGTWEGSENSISLTASGAQVRATSIVVSCD